MIERPLRRHRRRAPARPARRRRSRRRAPARGRCSIDRLAFMGGTSTAVLDTFYAFYTPGDEPAARRRRPGLGGRRAADRGRRGVRAAEHLRRGHRRDLRPGDAQGRLGAAGGRRGRRAPAAHVGDGRAARRRAASAAVRIWNKGGERWVEADAFVDASGDADVARDGRRRLRGRDDDAGDVQSLSTLFKLANVDVERASAVPKAELWALMRDAASDGGYRLPRRRGLVAPDAVRGRGAGPHDPDPQRRRDGPGAADPGRGRGPAAGAASTTASCATACPASSGPWSSPRRPRSGCARAAASSATTS